ncbi:TRAP-type mannitol/chloroaromatic compound transport system, small permease component [Tistlia consotensis]|uniref:TRAP transporter small permease protein n=1 Tax=Tistlia consotensis USBA 355 TaxID=560819 RepID=A0A1Y6C0D2_9PROT|nr:TRAP transporter small permease [Tistlia consotensis]SMF38942.1 TRAP-type mannitol/chloroaromatic compound transport system, small permease component [Tistlia consotensis USBA 355]SNR36675.1 TRAP-type mannitol/chloroaromatic compound transport system, small permease component [Tistlia consotensis]
MAKPNPIDRLSRFLGDQICYVFLITVAITAYEVVMRYVFNAATIWVTQTAIFLSALGFIFGGAYAMEQGRHIEITSIYDAVTPPVRRVFDLIRCGVAVVYLGFLLYATVHQAIPALSRMETSGQAWDVPIPAFQKAALALGVAAMLAQALRQLVGRLAGSPRPSGESS